MSDAVLFDARDDGIAIITLNRPETRNCPQQGRFAKACSPRGTASSGIRRCASPILTGAGDKAFCAGGDLKEMVETRHDACRRATCFRFRATTSS